MDRDVARQALLHAPGRSMWEFEPLLPLDSDDRVDLGEGWTPLVPIRSVGRRIGIANLWAKNESANPTWSHKDRLVAVSTAAAHRLGARATTAVSTGNHGASVAAYAARAGLPCVIFTLEDVPEAMMAFISAYGATVVAASTVADRNELMRRAISSHGLYPVSNASTPSVGSTPFGIEGYKTIAYELWLQLEQRLPEWIVVPVGYGDCISGVARGFADLVDLGLVNRMPRLVAAEVFGAVGAAITGSPVLRSGEPGSTRAFSIATSSATDQSVRTVRATGGLAVTASEDEIAEAQRMMGLDEGLFVEASAATAVAVVGKLAAGGVVRPTETVVVLSTSSGLKDPLGARTWQRPVVHSGTASIDLNMLLDEALTR
ncbi:pyridoxal-phosphate dependent enzyme [Kribbella sp. NPDC050124]|uniref:pyridoxal-phosphate dependent enzyme n=1 Tax=Kribbella sp. NPDC050124 TaxID=3364114 RepID=UPI0037A81593